jgi:hypothetical protein
MSALPGLVRRLLDEEAWREFDAPAPVGHVEHTSFRAFVAAKQPRGLGSRLGQLLALCGSDEELRARVQRAYDEETAPAPAHGEIGRGRKRVDDINSNGRGGTSREYIVARLKRDDPALAERVVRGEITPHAAARKAGITKPRVVLTSPESIAAALRRHLGPDDIAALIRFLLDDGGAPA